MKTRINNAKIKGHSDTWSEIGNSVYNGKKIYLLENDQWGDDTNFLLVDKDLKVLSDDVYDFHCLVSPDEYI